MNEPFDFGAEQENPIAYVRPVKVAELPAEMQKRVGGLSVIWAVHGEDGAQLALVADRILAFRLARENDLAPVNVH